MAVLCSIISIVRSTRVCRNVRCVITYTCISLQVRFLKNRPFWKIKSSVISNLDRQIRNYYKNGTKQPIHPLTRLGTCYNVWTITVSLPTMSPYSHFVSAFSRWMDYNTNIHHVTYNTQNTLSWLLKNEYCWNLVQTFVPILATWFLHPRTDRTACLFLEFLFWNLLDIFLLQLKIKKKN